jgi:hypothetical protein
MNLSFSTDNGIRKTGSFSARQTSHHQDVPATQNAASMSALMADVSEV